MRIAFVVGEFPKLSETFVLREIVGLLELGHDVRIFAFRASSDEIQQPAVAEHRLLERTRYVSWSASRIASGLPSALRQGAFGSGAWRYPEALAQRIACRSQGSFDVIYCHFGHIAEQARRLRRTGFFAGPLLAVFHAYDLTVWLRERGNATYRRLFDEAACLLPISDHWRKLLLSLGARPDRVEVHRMGVDCRSLSYREHVAQPGEALRVVSVGRLQEKKGIEYAIRAVARAQKELDRRLEYHVIGDGPLRPELVGLAQREGIADSVTFHGWKQNDEIAALLRSMHVLLAPSVTAANGDMEGIPVVLMEAMAQGLPVIATRHSGIPELIRDGDSGFLVAERDVAALAQALVRMTREPEQASRMAASARRTIEERFDSARLTRELAALFERLSPRP